jgi:hypothetical protein
MAAQGLNELLAAPRGREFLLSCGIHADPRAFRAALSPPEDRRLAQACGAGDRALVHMHQQIYVDYRPSVLGKVRVLDALANTGNTRQQPVHGAFLWIDTDRAASDKLACRFYWPFQGALRAMKITAPGGERLETRFSLVDPHRTGAAYQRIADYIRLDRNPAAAQQLARLASLRPRMVVCAPTLLDDYGLQLTRTLFRTHLGIEGSHLVLSDILANGWLTSPVEDVLAVLPEFICAWNAQITALRLRGIATAVGLLPPDYLPLHVSDPDDGERLRLHHEIIGGDHFASATARTGRRHRFFLGSRQLKLDELASTGRWSPDVILPMLANALFSGWVAGKSSALYALVFNKVLSTVLGRKPIPILVPEPDSASTYGMRASSLLHAHVMGAPLWPAAAANQRAYA